MLECSNEPATNNLFKRNTAFQFKFLAFLQTPTDSFHKNSVLQMYARNQWWRHNQSLEPTVFWALHKSIFSGWAAAQLNPLGRHELGELGG
jgi:hypothetical protein